MSGGTSGRFDAALLRREFDETFATAQTAASTDLVNLLAVRVGGDPYAIRLDELAAVVANRPITPFPTTRPDVLGLAGVRGALVPVFGLAALLGYPQRFETPRWLVVVGAKEPVAFAFPELEGYYRVHPSAFSADERPSSARPYLQEIAQTDTGPRPVIGMSIVVAAINGHEGSSRLSRSKSI